MAIDPHSPPPTLTGDLPGVGGRIKQEPEDFEVEEIPAYEPSGQGSFLFLWIEKRDLGAEYFVRQLARRLGLAPGEIGTAGLKDRRAITRQMVSVPDRVADRLDQVNGEGMTLLRWRRHGNKLRAGHLRGNRFRILIREVGPDAGQRAAAILARLQKLGLPNFYGPQRFGRGGETVALGLALLRGENRRVPSPFLRRLALSSAQSLLFNHYLASRLHDSLLGTVLAGDVMAKWPTGGLFVAEDVAREQLRLDARETVSAGPIFGRKTFAARDTAAEREAATLAESGLTSEAFRRFGKLLQGTRRHNVVYVEDLAAAVAPDGLRLTFTLRAGSYATILLHEITKMPWGETSEDG